MSRLVECPLCARHFHQKLVEPHAASCCGPLKATCSASVTGAVAAVPAPPPPTAPEPTQPASSSGNPLGPLRRSQSHDRPRKQTKRSLSLPEFDYLVVLDFEWTCDDNGALPGGTEIIEFPSVLLRLKPNGVTETVAEIQLYVHPERNPTLSSFCTRLTGITQEQVDSGLQLVAALDTYREWLVEQRLLPPVASLPEPPPVSADQNRAGPGWPRFALVTWSDADLGGQLYAECERKGLHHARPWWFRSWVNLKILYAQHYRREARGGLQACVEAIGQTFDGRAHSGLVDARNTAKIVVNMRHEGFRFVRTTRGCDAEGVPYGRDTNKFDADDDSQATSLRSEPTHKKCRAEAQ